MIDRSAVDTIRGYFYQFDLTILSILRLHGNQASIDVENIEDIDINHAEETTANLSDQHESVRDIEGGNCSFDSCPGSVLFSPIIRKRLALC